MTMNLNELNASLKRTNIKGKPYIDVAQRVQGFYELYPNGAIVPELLSDDGSRCTFIARVYVDGELRAAGHAFEFQSASMVNKTSYLENCETSAVGRALGFMGIGSTESICSADEAQAAIAHQENGEEPKRKNRPVDALEAAQKRITAIAAKYVELDGVPPEKRKEKTIEWYERNVKSRSDYKNDAETLNRISDELEESYGN